MTGGGLHLYHHNSSVCAAKVRIVLHEKRLDWSGEMLDLNAGEQFRPDYLRLNPKAVVPTLVHQGRPVVESNIIIEYLDDCFPEPPLRPAEPYERARMREWLKRLDDGPEGIHYATTVISYAASYRHQLRKLFGPGRAAMTEALERTMNPHSREWLREVLYEGLKAPAVRVAIGRLDAMLAAFEARLRDAAWLAGEEYSLADLAYTPYLTRLDLLGFAEMWQERPAVADWYARLRARPSYTEVIDRYRADFIEVLRERGRESWPAIRALLKPAPPAP